MTRQTHDVCVLCGPIAPRTIQGGWLARRATADLLSLTMRLRLRSLQHVSIPFRPGDEALIRHFYGDVLDLIELEAPKSLSHMGLIWFRVGPGLELHFFSGSPDPMSRRHFCFDVDDLEDTRRLLESTGAEPFDDIPIPTRPRFFCRDPVGNLIEFTRIEGDYSQQADTNSI